MKTTEMKEILYQKLQDEQCYFKKSDINIKKLDDNQYIITIKDFEPFEFKLKLSFDEGYEAIISQYYNKAYDDLISYITSKEDYDIENALIELGYYISTRF